MTGKGCIWRQITWKCFFVSSCDLLMQSFFHIMYLCCLSLHSLQKSSFDCILIWYHDSDDKPWLNWCNSCPSNVNQHKVGQQEKVSHTHRSPKLVMSCHDLHGGGDQCTVSGCRLKPSRDMSYGFRSKGKNTNALSTKHITITVYGN